MKNPLSVFSFGQIPTQWQQQKKIGCKVYRGFVVNKNVHKLPYFEEKNQEIARDLDNEFLEVTRTNSDPKNFSP
jgi:hypothetical protein